MFHKISLVRFDNSFLSFFIEISRQKKGIKTEHQAPIFRRLDNAIHWIKLYAVHNAIRSAITFPSHINCSLDSVIRHLNNWA